MTELYDLAADMAVDVPIIPISALRPDMWDAAFARLTPAQQTYAKARGFSAEAGQRLRLPDADGHVAHVLYGCGAADSDELGPIRLGGLSGNLPEGHYRLDKIPADWTMRLAAIGWGMGAYRYEVYLPTQVTPPTLVLETDVDLAEIKAVVDGTALCRDLINMPAGDLGPVALEEAAIDLAESFGAEHRSVVGEDLLAQNYPMIHAVSRAAHESPRLVEFEWGNPDHPRLAIIGKGITFDTGGVNMKSSAGSRIMKKDMGGAAHALALSHMIMATKLPVRLHCLVAIAENAVSAGAYRPGDILPSREGLTVEIDNTDAEGRLVLGDALCKAAEDKPVLMIDFATLTGAARVALGPHLPPFFSNRDAPIEGVMEQGHRERDPVWNMPLWQPYNSMLSSPIADLKNSGGSFAGAVTAALFLERFVKGLPWMHIDTYGWNPSARAGHPKGGDMYAVRALYAWLKSGGLNGSFTK
ncbi:M17 family metallopeptidase [Litorimonas sp. RW-G-Af-16]|uniref:leucyl aminopeptidase family protein n=1 Tax=Litorimonas sp. RW-G-Af-16 TaxID=3241168 RepID=UPI003AAFB8AD